MGREWSVDRGIIAEVAVYTDTEAIGVPGQERRERGRESVGEGDGEGGSRRGLQRWSLVSRTAIGESLIITMYSVHCTLYVVRCTSYTV